MNPQLLCPALGAQRRALLLAALLVLGPLATVAAQPPPGPAAWYVDPSCEAPPCGKARALWLRGQDGLPIREPQRAEGSGGAGTAEADDDTDVLHNNLDIEIDPTAGTIAGSNTMTIESRVDGLTEFTFRLWFNMAVTQALLNGATPASVTTTSTTTRRVTLDRPYDAGEVFTLRIDYNGTPLSRGFGSIEFTRQHGFGPPIVYTLSEPYFAYTWWPCKDGDVGEEGNNRDKATLELAVTAPSSLRTESNGVLLGVDSLSGGRSRYRWASDYPLSTYLVCFSSTEYNVWTHTFEYDGHSMPVIFKIYPMDDNAGNRNSWEVVLEALGVYSDLYGIYPFIDEKYGIYECEFSGGMEHQTNTAQGVFIESVNVHELSHQWWGDNVTCATWHDIWLNEGFATYSEALWYEFKNGFDDQAALFAAMDDRRPTSVGDSVYVYDTSSPLRIFDGNFSYLKASWVLHQLRHVVGDATFFSILAAYRAAYEGSAATTDDFAAVASDVYGGDLSWFFDEWVYGIGAPAYRTGWQTASIAGQNYLRLYLEQTQSASYGLYTMPLDVRVNYTGGNQTYTIFNDADVEWFVLPIPAPATAIVLDENDWVLTTSKSSASYVNGPPKIVACNPAPGALFDADSGPSQITVTFSEDVNASAADFTLVGADAGAVPFSFSYSSGSFTATLSLAGALPADDYTITVSDEVSSSAASIALDGEIADPDDPASLPSGEGLPDGSAVLAFHVQGDCFGDLTGDGAVDLSDLSVLLTHFGESGGVSYEDGDLNGDDRVDLEDLSGLLVLFGTSC